MKSIGYIRVSSIKQVNEGNSLFNQDKMIRDYCKNHNLDLIDIIKDEGVSGLKKDRSGIVDILTRVKKEKIDLLIVYSLSRLGRKMKDVIEIIDFLNNNNVRFISLKENFDNTGIMGKLLLNIMGSINEFEVNVMGERISDVKRYKKENKEKFGGRILYGVNENNGKLLVNHKEMEILYYINKLREVGYSYQRIADYLNDLKIKSKYRSKWYGSSVRMVMKNGVYNNMFEYVENKVNIYQI